MEYLKLIKTESEVNTEVTHDVVYYATEDNKVVFKIGYEPIDLGLSVKWANKNVGATSESDAGLYFQWGDTIGYTADQLSEKETKENKDKKYFGINDYKYFDGVDNNGKPNLTKYCNNSEDGTVDSLMTLESSDDAATVNMGSKWRMPTNQEFNELFYGTNIELTSINGVNYYKFTNKNDSSKYIFIPTSGHLVNGSKSKIGTIGSCWTSSLNEDNCYSANSIYLHKSGNTFNYGWTMERWYGIPVRGVLK